MMTDVNLIKNNGVLSSNRVSKTEEKTQADSQTVSSESTFEGVIGGPIVQTKAVLQSSALEDVRENDKAVALFKEEASKNKEDIDSLSGKLSKDTLKALSDEGISAGNSDKDIVEESIDQILSHRKEQREAVESEIERQRDARAAAKYEGLSDDEKAIAKKLEGAGLPATKENIEKVASALSLAKAGCEALTDTGIKYMVKNGAPQNIFNIYMADHVAPDPVISMKAYGVSESARNIDSDWEQVKPQAEKILKDSGVPLSVETINAAKWLFAKDLPINSDNIAEVLSLKNIAGNAPAEDTADRIIRTISLGKKAVDTVLGDANERKSEYALNVINNIEPDSIKDIAFRRRIEEARLSLSYGALLTMYDKGIKIDFTDIEQVSGLVERLKAAEDEYYKSLIVNVDAIAPDDKPVKNDAPESAEDEPEKYQADKSDRKAVHGKALVAAEPDHYKNKIDSQVTLMKSVMSVRTYALAEALKDDSAYIDGASLEVYKTEGSAQLRKAHEAGLAYSKGQTEIRADLGDSVKKAVRNVDELLSENDLPLTEANRKAAKMLAYNNAVVDADSVVSMKKATLVTVETLRGLTPAVVAGLIKGGRNPLDMSVNELFDTVKALNESTEKTDESYAAYLYRLDNSGQVTEEERQAYIGIYRLLNQIEASDGADIGSVYLSGRELTLRNMLSSIRSRKSLGFDKSVDDSFGELEGSLTFDPKRIDNEIDRAYISDIAMRLKNELSEESEGYLADQSEELKRFLSEYRENMDTLMTEGVKLTAYNLAAEGDIKSGRKSLSAITDTLTDEEKADLDKKARKALADMDDPDAFSDEVNEINDELTEKAENLSEADNMTFERFASLMMAKRTLKLSRARSDVGKFDLPLYYNGRTASLSVTIKQGKSEISGKIEIDIKTSESEVAGEFSMEGNSVSGFAFSESRELAGIFASFPVEMAAALKSAGFAPGEISFQRGSISSEISDISDIKNSKTKTKEVYRAAKVITTVLLRKVTAIRDSGEIKDDN